MGVWRRTLSFERTLEAGLAAERWSVGRRNVTIGEIGSIGELVAAIATVATLGYLAVQTRQSNRSSRAATAHGSSSLAAQITLGTAQDPTLADLWFRGLADPDSLDSVEHSRFVMLLSSHLTWVRNDFALGAEGLLPADLTGASLANISWLSSQPGFVNDYWPTWRHTFPPEFVANVDRAIRSRAPAAQPGAAADSA